MEHLLATSLLHSCITERGGEMLKNAGVEEKHLYFLRLPSQHLLGQIIQNIALISTHLLQQAERVSILCQGKPQKSQANQPALCASRHLLDCLLRQLESYHLLEDGAGLLCRATWLV